jgi:sugar lactone lactonase YvrE
MPNAALGLDREGPNYGLQAVPTPRPTPSVPGTDSLAGTGKQGTTDGAGASASFNGPTGIALDKTGTAFICDTRNNCLRKVLPDGATSTLLLTSATVTKARKDLIMSPEFIAVDSTGNLYVTSTFAKGVWKIDLQNKVTMWVGHEYKSGDTDSTGSSARFRTPKGIAFDSTGNMLVADNSCIRKVTPGGVVTTFTGQKFTPGYADTGAKPAQFRFPQGIAFDATGNLLVADSGNHCIRKVTPNGSVSTLAGIGGTSGYWDTGNSPLPKLPTSAAFNAPVGIAVDSTGAIFVTDSRNHCVRKVTAAGSVSTLTGVNAEPADDDGDLATATFHQPAGLAMDSKGLLFVSDRGNNKVRRVRTV